MNTLLVGMTQEEEIILTAALARFQEFNIMFRCSSYREAIDIRSNCVVEFTFISTRISDMSYHDFAASCEDIGWTAFLVPRAQPTSKLSLLAVEGYSAGYLAGFVSMNLLDRDLKEIVENIKRQKRRWMLKTSTRKSR